ncbi:MAG: hypothetical protein OXC57_08045 [Rhodobacteraceae bacterium]|nr:hypothetical protein [Paracoccaceae bacterium]
MKHTIPDYSAISKGPFVAKRAFQVLIVLVSLGILLFLFQIVLHYDITGNQDQSNIPLIKAETNLWVKPEDPGGKESKHTGYTVNVLVHGYPFNEKLVTTGYAPRPVELPVDLLSLHSRGIPLELEEELEEGDAPSMKTGKEILDDFFTQVEQGETPWEKETVPPESEKAEQNEDDHTLVITGRELMPAEVPEGKIIAYIGTYANHNLASNNWREIFKKYPRDLASRDWVIKTFEGSISVSYRLYVVGFDSEDEADSFCARIEAGGHPSCIRTLMGQ